MVFHPFERHSEPFIDELAQRIVVAKGTTRSLFLTELLAEERGGLKSSKSQSSAYRPLSSRLCDPDHYYGIDLIGKALAHALRLVDFSNASEGGRNGMSHIIGP